MIRRRALLASSVALPLFGQAPAFGGLDAAAADAHDIRYLVLDQRLAAARAAANAVSGRTTILPFASDITPAYDVLDRRLAGEPFAVAGTHLSA